MEKPSSTNNDEKENNEPTLASRVQGLSLRDHNPFDAINARRLQNKSPVNDLGRLCSTEGNAVCVVPNNGRFNQPTVMKTKASSNQNTKFSKAPVNNKEGRWGFAHACEEKRPFKLVEFLNREDGEALLGNCLRNESPVQQVLFDWDVQGKFTLSFDGTLYTLLLETETPLRNKERDTLKRIFAKRSLNGFNVWLGGKKGWHYEEDGTDRDKFKWKTSFVIILNSLQDVFKLFAPKYQQFMPDSKEMTWRKGSNLKSCVSDIRVWMETLRPYPVVNDLLRNSKYGPDAPIHWSHHHPRSMRYPFTIVTKDSMTELVNGIICIFRREFADNERDTSLGTRWRQSNERRRTDWKAAKDLKWNEDLLESLLNGNGKFRFD